MKDHITYNISFLYSDRRSWILLTVVSGWLVILGLRFLLPTILPESKESSSLIMQQ